VESPQEYIVRFERGESAHDEPQTVDATRHLQDRLMTGLRQSSGVALTSHEMACYDEPVRQLTARGWLDHGPDGRLRLTPAGVMFSNNVLEELLLG
jgi:coproporphyrinogen III oxidase-like Fe-S oxidoreductase